MDMSPSSPSSSTSPVRRKNPPLPGFRPSPRQQRPIQNMSVRELQDRHKFNIKLLSSPQASTSTYAQRVLAEQAEIEARLIEVDGVERINTGLQQTSLRDDNDMVVDSPPPQPTSRTLEAKRKALARFGGMKSNQTGQVFTMAEAMEIERQAHLQDKLRQERILEKKRRMGMPVRGETLSRQQQEARILAFMNHKPTESDLEDDSEEDSDDDPANWFDDDQDDGQKGQNIVYPDEEDYSDVIRVDGSRTQYSTFYEPRDEGD